MTREQIVCEILKVVLAAFAAGFAYFKFFREGEHKQRIQFDIDCIELGFWGAERIVEIGGIAENKGNVEQKFEEIRMTVRGLDRCNALKELAGHEPRLDFPVTLAKASLISKKWGYFFVRPRVKQRFPLVIRLPGATAHILVRSTFKYQGTDDIHLTERAFYLGERKAAQDN